MEMVEPYLEKIVKSAHRHSMIFEFHCCGKNEMLVLALHKADIGHWWYFRPSIRILSGRKSHNKWVRHKTTCPLFISCREFYLYIWFCNHSNDTPLARRDRSDWKYLLLSQISTWFFRRKNTAIPAKRKPRVRLMETVSPETRKPLREICVL